MPSLTAASGTDHSSRGTSGFGCGLRGRFGFVFAAGFAAGVFVFRFVVLRVVTRSPFRPCQPTQAQKARADWRRNGA